MQDRVFIQPSFAVISCPSFNVTNGNVSFSSLEYGGTATIECDPGFWTENNMDTMTVECHANKTWTMIPTCEGLFLSGPSSFTYHSK